MKTYRFIVQSTVGNFGTVDGIGDSILLKSGLRRIRDHAGAQTHDTIADLELCDAIAHLTYDSNNVLGEYSRQLVCDEQTCISASLIMRVETYPTKSA